MKRVLTISMLGTTVLLLVVLGLSLQNCGGGGGGGAVVPPNPNNALLNGKYRGNTLEQEWGKVRTRSGTATLNGTGYLPGGGTYNIADDRTITISQPGVENMYGLVSSDGTMAIMTDARYDIPGSNDKDVETTIAIKKMSSGLTCTAVSGDYVVIQAEARTLIGGEYYNFETGRIAMTLKTNCTGTWTILSHSTGMTGSGTFTDTLNADGTFTMAGYYPGIGTGGDAGVFSPDGSMFVVTDSETNADNDSTVLVAVGIKESVTSALSGTYQVHYMGFGTAVQFAGRMNAAVDTDHFDCAVLVDSRGSTWTSTPGYTLNADGTLTITGVGEGIVSPDGSFFTAVDTDPADGSQEIKLIFGMRH